MEQPSNGTRPRTAIRRHHTFGYPEIMPTIGGELQNRHAATWRRASVPREFGDKESSAPLTGVLRLPLHIWWSGDESSLLDMADSNDRRFAYEQILSNGTAADVDELIHPAQLVQDWDDLFLTAAVAEIWVPWFEAHHELCL
jgi:hypothetical protein